MKTKKKNKEEKSSPHQRVRILLRKTRRIYMKFGYFDDNAKEYVITSPKTPLPWINYLGCEDFFSLVSNTCGGYSFYKDAKLLRLTRYRYNNVPGDSGSLCGPRCSMV